MRAPTWDTERAAAMARKAYRYVATVHPREAGYEALDEYTDAAHEAEAAGDLDAFEDALRALMRTALEARTARRGAA
jgi:hypothetical protein